MDDNYFITILLLSTVCFLKGLPGGEGISFEGGATEVVLTVENGTVNELVLDCPYVLDEGDASGLVVKWFYNDPLYPFYQWIPGGQIATPQLTKLDELVDATFEHSTDPSHRFRALRLVMPTTAATGRYTCVVSSYVHEQSLDVYLTIYSLPSSLSLSAEEVSPGNVTVQCSAEPAFPRPELAVSLVLDGERKLLEGTSETTWSEGLYNTSVFAVVDEEDLAGEGDIQFECELSLPPTNLSVTESLQFGAVTAVEEAEEYTDFEAERTVVVDASTHRSARRPSSAAPSPLATPALQVVLLAALALARWCNSETPGQP